MTKMVTRWDCKDGPYYYPTEDATGEWVKYEDIKHLLQAESPAARTCRCDSAKADKCSGGDMMLICRCDCHQVNVLAVEPKAPLWPDGWPFVPSANCVHAWVEIAEHELCQYCGALNRSGDA